MLPHPARNPVKPSQSRSKRRRADREYQKVIDEHRPYFDARETVESPLLELIQVSRRGVGADSSSDADVISDKALVDQQDTVFCRSMADVIADDDSRPYKQRMTQADRIRSCGSWAGIHACPDGHKKPSRTYCDEPKYCRRCARVRAYHEADQLFLQTTVLLRRQITGYMLRLITLTVKPTGDIKADVQTALDAWRKTYRSKLKVPGAGALRRIEVGSEHDMVHMHVMYYGPWIDRDELLAEWKKHTGSRTCHVKAIRRDELKRACYEVSKYVADFDKWVGRYGLEEGLKKIYRMGRQLFKRRLTERYGVYRSQVWQSLYDEPMPKPKEPVPERCDCCGKLWHLFMPVTTPRGPPRMLCRTQSR